MSFHSKSDLICTSKSICIVITSNTNFDDCLHFAEQTKQAQILAPHNFGQAFRQINLYPYS